MNDSISREEAIEAVLEYQVEYCGAAFDTKMQEGMIKKLKDIPSVEQWHVIKKRPMTNDERIDWSERIGYDIEDEDAFIYLNLPDDGEEVLVSTQYGLVYIDTFCQDEGCYFEENGDMDGIVAWMEKPKPYRGELKND